jgi:hypothetical protein
MRRLLPSRGPHQPHFFWLLLHLDGHRGQPRHLGGRPPDGLQEGAHVGEVRHTGRGVIPRQGIVVPITVVIVLPRDRLRGRLLEGKPVEALLAPMFFQLLLLLGLADLALLGSILRLLLLGHQVASSFPSRLVFRKWRPCLLHRR